MLRRLLHERRALLGWPVPHDSHVRSVSTMMSDKTYSVGIVGATGAVGEEILSVLEKRRFPCSKVKLLASEKSAGREVSSPVYGPQQPFSTPS